MEQVVLPKSNRKICYQIFKAISFLDLVVFSLFLITSILIAYLLPNLILKWITTTITLLLGCLSLVKNSNETRVYNTIFNAIKYSTKLLVNRKVIVKPHYVNTSTDEVLQFNYKKESLFLSGIQLQSTNLQLLNIEQQKVILEFFWNWFNISNGNKFLFNNLQTLCTVDLL